MNPLFKILDTVFGAVDHLIERINPSLQNTIRSLFFLIIFSLVVAGIYYGYNKGRHAASIKSDPIARFTNQVFDIDIRKERDDGKFGDMLETETINELKMSDPNKIKYSAKESMEPDFDAGIVESGRDKKVWVSPEMENKNMIFEDNAGSVKKDDSRVRGITKKGSPFEENRDEIMDKSRDKIMPDNPSAVESASKTEADSGVSKKEKRKLIRTRDASPKLINRESDLIKN